MKWSLACAALAGAFLSTRPSVAAEVRWLAPPGCTDPRGTLEEAERVLGRPISAVESLDFDVRIADDDGQWTLRLGAVERATGQRRERQLAGASCDEVTAAAAVALAMIVSSSEPSGATALTDEPPAPEPAVAPLPAMSPAAPPRSKPPRTSAPSRLGLAGALAATGDVGALPDPAAGVEVAASLDFDRFRLTGLATLIAGSHIDDNEQGADFQLVAGAILGCARRLTGPTVAALCIGAEVGELSGEGAGVRNPRSGASLWWAPRLDLGLSLSLVESWSIFARAGATLPRIRPDFVLGDAILVHRPGVITGRLAIGVELELR